ncbi:MAB_1171c family putative transporter [Streptomyces sp. H27-D2]|uniref:MAB_1171c family putative transporter n=1 Tax=Streptomyces sp. H27-D2 TaxID=3046304 RepID=UPI002DBB4436|nr:MAB_1171c family putative transporter [Streptomyces sp. H27-D2]MEC4020240.1 MAB_1171c family putative transporter [Streptomyces sp. H27-D2]
MAVTVTFLFLSALAGAIAWKLLQLSKDPGNAPLRAVTLCLVCAGCSYPVAMPGGATGLDAVAGHGAAKLAQNVLLLATCYFLMCFYLYSAADGRAGRRRARREAVALFLVIVVITAITITAPRTALDGSFSTADMTVPHVAAFYCVAGLYLMYALTAAFGWTQRYARISQRPLSTGLWLVAVGLAGMAAACLIRAVFVVIRSQGSPVPSALTLATSLLLVTTVPLFVVGVTYPGVHNRITAMRIWHQHRQHHRQLYPLWSLLSEAFPHTVLPTSDSASWHDRWRARGVHRRYHRRIIECRDGLVQISPYLAPQRHNAVASATTTPERVAQRLRDITHPRERGAPGPEPQPSLALPSRRDRDADVQQLLSLSDALRTTT